MILNSKQWTMENATLLLSEDFFYAYLENLEFGYYSVKVTADLQEDLVEFMKKVIRFMFCFIRE